MYERNTMRQRGGTIMWRKFFVLIILSVVAISCGKKADNQGVQLEINLAPESVTDFLFLKVKYKITLSPKFSGLEKDYKMFVHFWRTKNKEMLLQDDHILPNPTTTWKKGDTLSYTREVFIPKFIDEFDINYEGHENVRLTIGLYNPDNFKESYTLFKKTLSVQSVSLIAPEIIYDDGWHQPETNMQIKNPQERNWRWTSKRSVCIIENPKKESTLIIRGAIDKNRIADQKVIIKINDQVLEEFIPDQNLFTKKYTINPETLGTGDDFNLIIETDKTFIPSKLNPEIKDNRELGIQIFFLYFREAFK